jgi:hypothetical protein
MLVTPCLSNRSFSLMAMRLARGESRDQRGLTTPTRAEPRPVLVEESGAAVDGVAGRMEGSGSGATFPAFPTPEGSLTEPLSPLIFPGPEGMPLTPAS